MVSPRTIILGFSLDDEAFTTVAKAISDLKMREKKLKSFNDLRAEGLIKPEVSDARLSVEPEELQPSVEETETYLRMCAPSINALRQKAARLGQETGLHCRNCENPNSCAFRIKNGNSCLPIRPLASQSMQVHILADRRDYVRGVAANRAKDTQPASG
jgi:hypothetical protein